MSGARGGHLSQPAIQPVRAESRRNWFDGRPYRCDRLIQVVGWGPRTHRMDVGRYGIISPANKAPRQFRGFGHRALEYRADERKCESSATFFFYRKPWCQRPYDTKRACDPKRRVHGTHHNIRHGLGRWHRRAVSRNSFNGRMVDGERTVPWPFLFRHPNPGVMMHAPTFPNTKRWVV
jgi:hypothetical protein